MLRKGSQVQPEHNYYIWDQGLKQQQHLGNKKTLNNRNNNEALRPDHRAGNHKASSWVFCWNSKNDCEDTVELATAQVKEETTSSLRSRDA